MEVELRIDGGTLVLPGDGMVRAGLAVSDGKIVAIGKEDSLPGASRSVDASGLYVLPGLFDPHGHVGFVDFAGECETETRAAIKGGLTTVGLFVRSRDDSLQDIPQLIEAVEQRSFVDVFFSPVLGEEEQVRRIPDYVNTLGIRSFKFMMWAVPGVKILEDGFLLQAFEKMGTLGLDVVACVHAENKSLVDQSTAREAATPSASSDLKRYAATHPPIAEAVAIETAARLAAGTGARLYIVHLSSRDGLEAVSRLKSTMPNLFVETTTHHLVLTEDCSAGILAKIAPPVRDKSHSEALWGGLASGLIDVVGTDNLPRTREQKNGGWQKAITGFPGYATLLPLMLEEGYHKRKIPLDILVSKMTANPARVFGFYPRKGTIRIGSDADIVLVDLNKEGTVRWQDMGSWSDFSVYEGMKLKGWPVMTIKGGKIAYADGELLAKKGSGRYLSHQGSK